MPSPQRTALHLAVELAGGQAGLARMLSTATGKTVSQQRVWNALHRDRVIPAGWCLAIETATGGRVKREELRPDLYPKESNHHA
ncbi:MAG TPA: YdaS family helix-turn-helix protein [Bryobacteraceae bacterium]|nr:YdaS family helix-turn-helix protein [Bryobacteraceae bacterium]